MPKLQLKEKRFLCRFFDPVLYAAHPYGSVDDGFDEFVFYDESLEGCVDRVRAYAKSLDIVPFDICEVVYEFELEDM